ncbi:cupin domain-containing protein [Nocardia lijiangensis]|uniref:cupin domain-containing protein n=1 Tax=Nocardia lijiangensis TaxID=299618 RepID=UPI0008348465|nr:cupin domain-containing protein [Nocardia lijiangensis]
MRSVRRIVTGHDGSGRPVIVEDADCRHIQTTAGAQVVNLWLHEGPPRNDTTYADPVGPDVPLPPPAGGGVLRVVEFGPRDQGETPYLHRTPSLDYAFVIAGEVVAVVGSEETVMRAGDVLIQRGTTHAWDNRSDTPCTILFVLLDTGPAT